MHHPLSKLHFEGRRKKSGKKKKESDRKDNSGPTSSTSIEEGEDEEDNEEEGGESHTHLSETYCDTVKEDVQVISDTYANQNWFCQSFHNIRQVMANVLLTQKLSSGVDSRMFV